LKQQAVAAQHSALHDEITIKDRIASAQTLTFPIVERENALGTQHQRREQQRRRVIRIWLLIGELDHFCEDLHALHDATESVA
jgi:hypothetical protein